MLHWRWWTSLMYVSWICVGRRDIFLIMSSRSVLFAILQVLQKLKWNSLTLKFFNMNVFCFLLFMGVLILAIWRRHIRGYRQDVVTALIWFLMVVIVVCLSVHEMICGHVRNFLLSLIFCFMLLAVFYAYRAIVRKRKKMRWKMESFGVNISKLSAFLKQKKTFA